MRFHIVHYQILIDIRILVFFLALLSTPQIGYRTRNAALYKHGMELFLIFPFHIRVKRGHDIQSSLFSNLVLLWVTFYSFFNLSICCSKWVLTLCQILWIHKQKDMLSSLQMLIKKWKDRSMNNGNWAIINTVETGAWFSRSTEEGGLIYLRLGVQVGVRVDLGRESVEEVICGCAKVSGTITVTDSGWLFKKLFLLLPVHTSPPYDQEATWLSFSQ